MKTQRIFCCSISANMSLNSMETWHKLTLRKTSHLWLIRILTSEVCLVFFLLSNLFFGFMLWRKWSFMLTFFYMTSKVSMISFLKYFGEMSRHWQQTDAVRYWSLLTLKHLILDINKMKTICSLMLFFPCGPVTNPSEPGGRGPLVSVQRWWLTGIQDPDTALNNIKYENVKIIFLIRLYSNHF